MDEKSLKPQLRFKEFTDAWEQRKLSKIATMHARIGWQNLRKSEFLDSGDYYLITGTDFDDGKIDLKNCHYVAKERYEQDKNIQVKNGSILITKDGTLGKVAYVSNLQKPATLNAGVFNVELLTEDTDRKYLFQYLKAPFLMSYVSQKATGGTIKHLNQNILVDFPVIRPKKIEQQKIGTFFSNLDNLITLHQRKLDKLSNVKKALLEKMFPKNDSDVPEIRFKGFTDAWEQRKFQDMFSFERPDPYIVKSDKYSNEYTMPVLTANKAFVLGYTKENSPCKKTSLIFDDFTLECKYVDFPYMVKSSAIKILTVKDEKKDNLRFSFERLNTTKIEILGHARHYISVVQPTKTRTPNILEQNKISELFSNLDNLITLHQRKLEKLKNIKKACLEKMFV